MLKTLLPAALLGTLLAAAPSASHAAFGQINNFGASANSVVAGTVVDFFVDFGVSTNAVTNGGSNPEPEPAEGYQSWQVNWYNYENETLTSVWLEAGGQTYNAYPSVPAGGSYSGTWTFSILFPTEGTFDIALSGGWSHSIETYHSNESAYRDCINNDPGGTNELSCSSWTFMYDDGGDTYSGDGTFGYQNIAIQVTAVPEPESWALIVAGALVVGAARHRRA